MAKKDVIPYEVVIDKVLKAMDAAHCYIGREIREVLTDYCISANDLEISFSGMVDARSDIEVWYELWNGDVREYISLRADWSEYIMARKITNEIQYAYDDNRVPLGDDERNYIKD